LKKWTRAASTIRCRFGSRLRLRGCDVCARFISVTVLAQRGNQSSLFGFRRAVIREYLDAYCAGDSVQNEDQSLSRAHRGPKSLRLSISTRYRPGEHSELLDYAISPADYCNIAVNARQIQSSARGRTSSTPRAALAHLCDSSLRHAMKERCRPPPSAIGRTRRVPIEDTLSSQGTR
jgi:hypothetical protein